jgi:hypothetical protein
MKEQSSQLIQAAVGRHAAGGNRVVGGVNVKRGTMTVVHTQRLSTTGL